MNGAQQVERFTAVSRLEKRLEDLELVVEAQTALILKQKDVIDQDLQVLDERFRVYADHEVARLDAVIRDRQQRDASWDARSWWSRLAFVLSGRA